MAKERQIGLNKAEIGDVGADGAMGGTLATLLGIVEDTFAINQAEAEIIRFYNEGQNDPDMIRKIRNGEIVINFEIRDVTPEMLELFFGGSVALDVYSAPVTVENVYQSFKVTQLPEDGQSLEISFPRVLMSASWTGNAQARNDGRIIAALQVCTPYDASNYALPAFTAQYI